MTTITETETCGVCGGLGLLRGNAPVGHPEFGKLFPCRCEAGQFYARRRTQGMLKRAGLPQHYESLSFDSFWELSDGARAGKMLAAAAAGMWAHKGGVPFSLREAAAAVDERRASGLGEYKTNWIVLHGDLGMGKTGLAAAAVNYLSSANTEVVFYRLQEVFAEIQSQYGKDGNADEVLQKIQHCPRLILDECTIPAASTDKQRIFEEVVRFRAARGLATIFTTNHDQEAFERQWTKQAAAVVFTAHWIELTGEPLRFRAKPVKGW